MATSSERIDAYARAVLGIVSAEGFLAEAEDELFRFARVFEGNDELRMGLSDPALPVERRQAVVVDDRPPKERRWPATHTPPGSFPVHRPRELSVEATSSCADSPPPEREGQSAHPPPASPTPLHHFAATSWLRGGAGLDDVRRLHGHESLNTTLRYSSLVGANLQRAHRRASAIERLNLD